MINRNGKQKEYRRSMDAEREELQQATQHFMRSISRSGIRLALLPVTRLPREPWQHFQAAGREFTHGWAALIRALADHLEEMAKDANTVTKVGESPDTDGKLE
jgi:hypothetical protein